MSFWAAETVSWSSGGRPGARPRFLAAAMPSRVRSEMSWRSKCAMEPKTWNTSYIEKAANHLRRERRLPDPNLLRHVSPLGWEHIVLTGDYDWNSGAAVQTNARQLNLYPARIRA